MNNPNKIELHYFFMDESHAMDAFVRHKCEAEILAIINTIASILDIEIDVLSEAYAEGGLKEVWKFLGKNSKQITAVGVIVSTMSLLMSSCPNRIDKLQEENLELNNEKLQNEIISLKIKINSPESQDNSKVIKDTVDILNKNYKVIKHRSNFYQNLTGYKKVTQISTKTLENGLSIDEQRTVSRADFYKFILQSDQLPTITVENAVLEIVSPVLKKGKYHWRGIYEGKAIDFSMNDEAYKASVLKKEITFHSEYYIYCVLKISRKIDDFGNIVHSGYTVTTVIGNIVEAKVIETEQGKRYRQEKAQLQNQIKLF